MTVVIVGNLDCGAFVSGTMVHLTFTSFDDHQVHHILPYMYIHLLQIECGWSQPLALITQSTTVCDLSTTWKFLHSDTEELRSMSVKLQG